MKQKCCICNFIPLILWLVLIYILLTLPGKDFDAVGFQIPNLDKVVHIVLFGGVVFWFGVAYKRFNFEQIRLRLIGVTVFSCLFGVSMEYVQKYFTNNTRSFSYADMLADATGAIIAYFVVRYFINKYPNSKRARKNKSEMA